MPTRRSAATAVPIPRDAPHEEVSGAGRINPESGTVPEAEPPPGGGPDDVRHRRIAERAYRRAEQRGFVPGHEFDDWLAAEAEEFDERYDP